MYKRALVISGRNLGDAVIQSRSVRKLLDEGFAERMIIWTRPACVPAYIDDSRVDVVASPFPLIAKGPFGLTELREFRTAARKIAEQKPDISLDFFGDKREWLFARMVGRQRHVAIAWAPRHPFRHALGIPGRQRLPDGSMIPSDVINVYQAYELYVKSLLAGQSRSRSVVASRRHSGTIFRRVGLHPFASRECNLWPDEHWVALGRYLIERGAEIWVLGSPADRPRIAQIFAPILGSIHIEAVPLDAFLREIGSLDLLIGLDSLGVHAADRAGVRSIVIAGASPKEMWRPPSATSIGQSGGCSQYPCYNRPTCTAGPGRFACIRSISPAQVLQALEALKGPSS